jgi:hypothetical protein
MPRKIEDIKLNKDKKQITFREEIVLRGEPKKEIGKIVIKKEEEIAMMSRETNKLYKEEYIEEKIIKEKESKIDEYLKSRSSRDMNTESRRIEKTPKIKNDKRAVGKTLLFVFIQNNSHLPMSIF